MSGREGEAPGDRGPEADDMKPELRAIDKVIFHGNDQWEVPVYQRHYVWKADGEDDQVPIFWGDLEVKARDCLHGNPRNVKPGYLGAIIRQKVDPTPDSPTGTQTWELIDGQQRITTLHLALIAMLYVAGQNATEDDVLEDFEKDVQNLLLLDSSLEPGRLSKKNSRLLPASAVDVVYQRIYELPFADLKEAYGLKVVDGERFRMKSRAGFARLLEAYVNLYTSIEKFVQNEREKNQQSPRHIMQALLTALTEKFKLIVITLGKQDDPYVIFEALNGRGERLSQFDLVRNSLFRRLEESEEEERTDGKNSFKDGKDFFKKYWSRFDTKEFWTTEIQKKIGEWKRSEFMLRDLVIAETAEPVPPSRVASRYNRHVGGMTFKDEVVMLKGYADAYEKMLGPHEKVTAGVPLALVRLSRLFAKKDIGPLHPLILWLMRYIPEGPEREKSLQMMESFIVRREVCGLSEKAYNTLVPRLVSNLKEEQNGGRDPCAFLRGEFLGDDAEDGRRIPPNDELVHECEGRALDKMAGRILPELEVNELGDDAASKGPKENLHVEHILPKEWRENWLLTVNGEKKIADKDIFQAIRKRTPLAGDEAQKIREREQALHTIGNCSLLTQSLNSALRNKSWDDKTRHADLKKKSLAEISRRDDGGSIWDLPDWDEGTILKRSQRLAKLINKRWPRDPWAV